MSGFARVATFAGFVFLLLFVLGREARAQSVDIKANVSPDTVEVGERFTYVINAQVKNGEAPTDVQPGQLGGMQVIVKSASPVQFDFEMNGQRSSTRGMVASWALRPTKPGTFTLGPGYVVVNGARRPTPAVRVKVVPQGQKPRGSPFDPWKGIFDFGSDDDLAPPPQPKEPTADPKLAMDVARAPTIFLRAVVDKTHAVVGEQVTLTIYLYHDLHRNLGKASDVRDATATDFLKRPLLPPDADATFLGKVLVGSELWGVELIRKEALFPLKTGKLLIEPLSLTFPSARIGLRESDRLTIDVTEPPAAGRPAGYALGDVGDMALQATVTPRSIPSGGAVGATIELRGTGNLPSQLTLPVASGVEWLDAQTSETQQIAANDRAAGTKTFSYVVRIAKEGQVDLGEVRIPYWDPDKRAYAIARASLGLVDVTKGAGARDAGADDAEPVLPGLPKARRALEGAHDESYLAERPFYWAFVFGAPFASVLAIGARRLVRRVRDRRAAAAPSPARIAKERHAEAEAACAGDDGKAAMGAIARAVEATVLDRTGVNVRGGAGEGITRELVDAGVDDATAKAIVATLRTCEDARFSPEGVAASAARATWDDARKTLEALGDAGGKKA